MIKNLTVANRMALGFGFAFLILLTISLVTINKLSFLRDTTVKIVKKDWPKVVLIAEINNLVKENGMHSFELIHNNNSEETRKQIAANKAKITADIEQLEEKLYLPEGKALLQKIKESRAAYVAAFEKVPALLRNNDVEAARQVMLIEVVPKQTTLNQSIADLMSFQGNIIEKDGNAAELVFTSTLSILISLVVASAVLMVIKSYLIIYSVVTPLGGEPKDVADIAKSIAEGDFTTAIKLRKNDNNSLLANMQKMQSSLRETIAHIATSSSQLKNASVELNTVTEDSTRRLQEQNLQLEQASSAINQMTFAVDDVARNAASTSTASAEADHSAKHGHKQVQNTIDSISSLSREITEASDGIAILAEQVKGITKVLDVIRAVSEQTNLLALNAAIEAARAGEAGRGFAVVADEVRSLAHRTQQSTLEIEEIIDAIRSCSEQAVDAMTVSKERAQSTLSLANFTGDALNEISQAITQINDRNVLIASSSEEQAHATREVDRNIIMIRDLSIESATSVNQTNVGSQELARLANQLNGLIARFTI